MSHNQNANRKWSHAPNEMAPAPVTRRAWESSGNREIIQLSSLQRSGIRKKSGNKRKSRWSCLLGTTCQVLKRHKLTADSFVHDPSPCAPGQLWLQFSEMSALVPGPSAQLCREKTLCKVSASLCFPMPFSVSCVSQTAMQHKAVLPLITYQPLRENILGFYAKAPTGEATAAGCNWPSIFVCNVGMFPAGNELLQRVSNGGRQLPWERQQSISWGKSGSPTHFCSWGGRATMTRTSSPLILARPSLWRWHRTQHLFPALGHVEEQGTEPANSTMHGQERLLTINEKWCYLQQSILSQTLTTVSTRFHDLEWLDMYKWDHQTPRRRQR